MVWIMCTIAKHLVTFTLACHKSFYSTNNEYTHNTAKLPQQMDLDSSLFLHENPVFMSTWVMVIASGIP